MTHSTAAALALANVPGQLVAFDIAECAPAGFQLDLFSSAEQAVAAGCTVCGATATVGSLCVDCDYWCDGNR
jgi:hypothetical protein